MQTIKFFIPEWAVSALINDDPSGLSMDEMNLLSLFSAKVTETYKQGYFTAPDDDSEAYFRHGNDVDKLAGNVYEITYVIMRPARLHSDKLQGGFNPYTDNNWKDRTAEVEAMTDSVLKDLANDPHYFAELVADMFFHWKHNTHETPLMLMFAESVDIKNAIKATDGVYIATRPKK